MSEEKPNESRIPFRRRSDQTKKPTDIELSEEDLKKVAGGLELGGIDGESQGDKPKDE